MQWPKTKKTENQGLLHVQNIVNECGGIFRKIPGEEDVGLDGVIEFVVNGIVTGRLLAVQIKSGDSYLASGRDKFVVSVDESHLHYWLSYDLPVILICYSPTLDLAAWQDIKLYVKHKRLPEKTFPERKIAITSIEVPLKNVFNEAALSGHIYNLTTEHSNERFLFEKANMLLSSKAEERREGLLYFWLRLDVLRSRLVAFLASQLILDRNLEIVRLAARNLGYYVAERKWSFYPDFDVVDYASSLCTRFDERHIRRLVECVEDGDFGPMSLGEACLDCMRGIWAPDVENALRRIVLDKKIEMYARFNALFIFYGCNWEAFVNDRDVFKEEGLDDILDWALNEQNKREKAINDI